MKRAMQFYHSDEDNKMTLPPEGQVLEVGVYKKALNPEDFGSWERENGDVFVLAWLMRYKMAKEGSEIAVLEKFKKGI